MIICFVTKKRNAYWTNMYKDLETFCKENPTKRVMFAFEEKDDLLNGDIILNGKSLLSKQNIRVVTKI